MARKSTIVTKGRRRLRLVLMMALSAPAAILAGTSAAQSYFLSVAPWATPASLRTNPLIETAAISATVGVAASGAETARHPDLARRTLLAQPLNPAAVRLLGSTDPTPDGRPSIAALELSERLSRRDRWTQVLLMQAKAEKLDPGVVSHINRLLSVRPALVSGVLPQLLAFVGDGRGRTYLARHSERPWFSRLVREATPVIERPASLAQLVLDLERTPEGLDENVLGRLAGRLASSGDYPRAVAIATVAGMSADELAPFSPSLPNSQPQFTPLTWAMANEAAGVVAIDGSLVRVDIQAGAQIAALTRVTGYEAGRYRLVFEAEPPAIRAPVANWRLQCFRDSAWAVHWQSGWRSLASQTAMEEIAIPEDCPSQQWTLLLQGPEGQGMSSFTLDIAMAMTEISLGAQPSPR